MQAPVDEALSAWRRLLGPEHVLTDQASVRAAETATFATAQRIAALIRPGNRAEVQGCMRVANEWRVPVYPVSAGKNWGLGSRVPPADGCVLLDLSRLNRIVDFNAELAYLSVEPGVTFQQAHDFLRAKNAKVAVAAIGGPPEGSLIGNTVERGDGAGPYGDRLTSICAMEVVLPTGECIHTGFGRFPGARAAPVHRTGVGPALEGLFTQSNLGIVTQMTLWLMPLPDFFQRFTFRLADLARWPALAGALRSLMFRGLVRDNCAFLWNSYKVLMGRGQYPWTAQKGATPLSLWERFGAECWYGSGALYSASKAVGLAERAEISQVLGPVVDDLVFADQEGEDEDWKNDLFLGVPSSANLQSVYWRKRFLAPSSKDPDRDRCGVLWLCPAFPIEGDLIVAVLAQLREICLRDGFEPNMGMQMASPRVIHVYVMLVYDREIAGEDDRALACHQRLLECLADSGIYPYRLALPAHDRLRPAESDYVTFLEKVKQALDPHGILAPGRYDVNP